MTGAWNGEIPYRIKLNTPYYDDKRVYFATSEHNTSNLTGDKVMIYWQWCIQKKGIYKKKLKFRPYAIYVYNGRSYKLTFTVGDALLQQNGHEVFICSTGFDHTFHFYR
jgi:hypothetical protein